MKTSTAHAPSVDAGTIKPIHVQRVSFVILGQIYSLKNSKQLSTRNGRPRIIKNWKARKFEEDFLWQVPLAARLGLTNPVRVTVRVFYPSMRQDLDTAILYDLLQTSGVIKNDRQVIEKHEFREVDRIRPRAEIAVEVI